MYLKEGGLPIYMIILFRALCKLVNERPDSWDSYLDPVMFGLRTKKHITTKFSPFFLLFGIEARLPCEVPEEYKVGSV